MNKRAFTFYFSCFFVLMSFSFVRANSFISDLKLGMTNNEVLLLQKALNTDPDTFVASEGVGAQGYETNYFGVKTESAVKRFQEKYKDEILSPLNLTFGTGIVGTKTRAVLNRLFSDMQTSSILNSNSGNSSFSSQDYDYTKYFPMISSVTPSSISDPRNQVVTISGSNFTQNNKVFLAIEGFEVFEAGSSDGSMISVLLNTRFLDLINNAVNAIPENTEGTARKTAINLLKSEFNSSDKDGVYVPATIFVQNENGESNKYRISINLFKDVE